MRFVPLLVLVAILLWLAPADFARADCSPWAGPECTCIAGWGSLDVELPSLPLESLLVTPANLSLSGGVVKLISNNNYPGQSTISPRLFEPVRLAEPYSVPATSFSHTSYIVPAPIPTVTLLAPTASQLYTTQNIYSPPASSGVLSIELANNFIPTSSSALSILNYQPSLPQVTNFGNLQYILTSSLLLPELVVPEPTSLALVTFGLIAASAGGRPRFRR